MRTAAANFQVDNLLVGVTMAGLAFAAEHMSKCQIIPFSTFGINIIFISRTTLVDAELQDVPQLPPPQ